MDPATVIITIAGLVFEADFENNATAQALIDKMPFTVAMDNLFAREYCNRLSESLPAREVRRSGYKVGDIAYWTPGKSLVIFYKQNGEIISGLQKIGRIRNMKNFPEGEDPASVTFELK